MIIVALQGGLGNQMFQYALGRFLSLQNNTDLLLDITHYQEKKFRTYDLDSLCIHATIATPEEINSLKPGRLGKIIEGLKPYKNKHFIEEKGFQFDKRVLQAKDPVYLTGAWGWQNEQYFTSIKKMLREDFKMKPTANENFLRMMREISETNSVSLHIRRTDYLTDKHRRVYSPLSLEYYQTALKYIREKNPATKLFIFSDDIEWVMNNFTSQETAEGSVFVSNQGFTAAEELMLMSACKHNITANSTYSWWGAWLNSNPDKIIITPKKWFEEESRNHADLVPSSWISL